MKTENKLARILLLVAKQGAVCDGVAAGVLSLVKSAGIKTTEEFETVARAAYEANGWNVRQGKPEAGSQTTPVPATVRTYMWEVRAAYRAGLTVTKYRTFYELRKARKALNQPVVVPAAAASGTAGNGTNGNGHTYPPEVAQDLQGVRVNNPEQDTGALFHDIIGLFVRLDSEPRLLFGRQLTRLMHTYQRKAVVTPAKGRRAATG